LAINGDGYFIIEDPKGEMGLSRRGDFTMSMNGELLNGAGEKVLDTSLNAIKLPPWRKIFVSENGQIFIQPMGAEPGTRVLVNQIGSTSGENLDLVKDTDGVIRPRGGFVREEFNPDQMARMTQGYIETSNVSVFNELVNNVEIQKQFQLNVKLISLAKELDEVGSGLMRIPN